MFTPNTDITLELQNIIDRLSKGGGGEILIPPGDYFFRPVELKSNICICLQAGARLVASPRREDYFPIGYDHNEMGEVFSAIYALGARNIILKGDGEIDLSGEDFYHLDRPTPVETTGPEITQEYLDEAPRTFDWRVNQPIFFHDCENVTLNGLRIGNAPCWTLSFCGCRKVRATDLTIENSLVIPNSDGMHFSSSRDIQVRGCFITAGDDCVAFTAITDWNTPCENITVSDCVFQSASKAISVGYMHSIVRNVLIENVVIKKSNRPFVLMCHPRTGLVENVRVHNCIFEGRSYGGNWWGNGEPIVVMVTPHHMARYRDPMPPPRHPVCLRKVVFSHLICRGERPVCMVADEPVTENIRMEEVIIEIVPEEKPSLKGNVIDLAPGPINYPIPASAPEVVIRNVDLHLQGISGSAGAPAVFLDGSLA
jgi:hypothetical protein